MADILIAEDSPQQSSLISSFLESTHNIIGEVDNGRRTIEVAEESEPDVIIMDINMPEVDGVQATRELKGSESDIGIIISTVLVDKEPIREAKEAGADAILTKPYTRKILLEEIDKLTTSSGVNQDGYPVYPQETSLESDDLFWHRHGWIPATKIESWKEAYLEGPA